MGVFLSILRLLNRGSSVESANSSNLWGWRGGAHEQPHDLIQTKLSCPDQGAACTLGRVTMTTGQYIYTPSNTHTYTRITFYTCQIHWYLLYTFTLWLSDREARSSHLKHYSENSTPVACFPRVIACSWDLRKGFKLVLKPDNSQIKNWSAWNIFSSAGLQKGSPPSQNLLHGRCSHMYIFLVGTTICHLLTAIPVGEMMSCNTQLLDSTLGDDIRYISVEPYLFDK